MRRRVYMRGHADSSSMGLYTTVQQTIPDKSFAAVINTTVQPNQLLGLCGPLNDLALGFNLGRFVPTLPEIPEVIHYLGEGREAFCVVGAEAYQRLREETGRPFRIVARQEFDRSTLFLISNQR
jgi:hypothetical protein